MIANVNNLAADLGAIGAAVQLVVGGNHLVWVALFGLTCILLQIFTDYRRYISILKWLTLSLFAYVGVVFVVDIPWKEALIGMIVPNMKFTPTYLGPCGRGFWHHHQPLFILLAIHARSRRHHDQPTGPALADSARSGRG